MYIAIGIAVGLALIGGALFPAFAWPSKPLTRRDESDHGAWRDSGNVSALGMNDPNGPSGGN
jgi:hypothetical protein